MPKRGKFKTKGKRDKGSTSKCFLGDNDSNVKLNDMGRPMSSGSATPVFPEQLVIPLPPILVYLKYLRLAKAAKGALNIIPEGKLANHLFRGVNKLVDNPANRTLIQKIANGKPLGVDAYGKSWYMGVD